MERVVPIGLRQERRDDVGDEHEREDEEHLLDALVAAADDQQPHGDRGDRHGDVARHAEHLHARRDAGELRERGAHVADEQGEHRKRREADAEALADERGESLAGDGAHLGRGHLDHQQQHAHHGDDPQRGVAEFGADGGVRRDAARVVSRHGGDNARAERGQNQQELAALLLDDGLRGRRKLGCFRRILLARGVGALLGGEPLLLLLRPLRARLRARFVL